MFKVSGCRVQGVWVSGRKELGAECWESGYRSTNTPRNLRDVRIKINKTFEGVARRLEGLPPHHHLPFVLCVKPKSSLPVPHTSMV